MEKGSLPRLRDSKAGLLKTLTFYLRTKEMSRSLPSDYTGMARWPERTVYKSPELWDSSSACLETAPKFSLSEAERVRWSGVAWGRRKRSESEGELMSRLQRREGICSSAQAGNWWGCQWSYEKDFTCAGRICGFISKALWWRQT